MTWTDCSSWNASTQLLCFQNFISRTFLDNLSLEKKSCRQFTFLCTPGGGVSQFLFFGWQGGGEGVWTPHFWLTWYVNSPKYYNSKSLLPFQVNQFSLSNPFTPKLVKKKMCCYISGNDVRHTMQLFLFDDVWNWRKKSISGLEEMWRQNIRSSVSHNYDCALDYRETPTHL